MTTGSFERV